MNRRVILSGAMLLGLSGSLFWQVSPWQASPTQAAEEQMAMPAPEVAFVTVEQRQIQDSARLPGRTTAFRLAEVRPQVNGILTQRLFDEGAVVEQGQALYQIDPAVYEAALVSAEAQLRTAEANAELVRLREERLARLVSTEAVSQQDYDTVKAELAQADAAIEMARAAVKTAEINLDYTRVYAPIGGQISQSLVTEGALVSANQQQALAIITQLDPIYVDLMQSSEEHMQMRNALAEAGNIPVTLEVQGAGEESMRKGTLQFSSVWVNPETGAVQLRTLFPNPDHVLLPGMFVHASLQTGSRNAILIPQQTTQRDATGAMSVWRLNADNTVTQVQVAAEREVGDQWLITGGLQAGDRIVMEGFQRIAPGMQVNATPF